MSFLFLYYGFDRISRVDPTDGTTIYYGQANKGAETSEDMWQIKRLIKISTVWVLQWANGDNLNNNIWDNRTSLEYS